MRMWQRASPGPPASTFAVGAKAYAFEGQFALALLGGPHGRALRRRPRTAGAAKVRQRVAATARAEMNRIGSALADTDPTDRFAACDATTSVRRNARRSSGEHALSVLPGVGGRA